MECTLPVGIDPGDGEHEQVLQMIVNRGEVLQKLTTLVQRIIVQGV